MKSNGIITIFSWSIRSIYNGNANEVRDWSLQTIPQDEEDGQFGKKNDI